MAQIHKNEVRLHGVLARDPEIKYMPSGKAVANFSVRTTFEKYNEFHRCVAWESQAEKLGEKFRKGDYIRLVGRLQTRSWGDKQTGQKKYVTEIITFQIAAEESEPPLTPDQAKSGTGAARAILSPAKGTSDDLPF